MTEAGIETRTFRFVTQRLNHRATAVPIYKYNVSVNSTTLYFTVNKNSVLSGRHVSTFIRSSSGPLENRSKSYLFFNAFGIPQCRYLYSMHLGSHSADISWICFPRGPEDDPIKVETCRPDNTLFLLSVK